MRQYHTYADLLARELQGTHLKSWTLTDVVMTDILRRAMPWARLGIARAQLEGGHSAPARRTLESLLSENPTFADAYDVMGRAQLQAARPDLQFVELRGNIHTRLGKVPPGGAIVMAVAALEILGLMSEIARSTR